MLVIWLIPYINLVASIVFMWIFIKEEIIENKERSTKVYRKLASIFGINPKE